MGGPIRRRLGALVTLALLFSAVTGVARAAEEVPPEVARALGPQAVQISEGHYEITLPDGLTLTTHGPDPRPDHGTDFGPGDPERAPACATDYYQHVLYGAPAGLSRYATVKAQIQSAVRRMNAVLNEEALESGGLTADFKVLCDTSGAIKVDEFTTVGGYYYTIVEEARAAGYDEPNADYTIFMDGELPGICGIGSIHDDQSPGANNANNNGNDYAITYNSCWNGRTPMHENGHNQGAVQYDAPYSTGSGWHCWDLRDVMCYSPDGGDKHQTGTVTNCPEKMHYDCGHDTYFDAAPEPGEYLATNWNIGSSVNRFITFGDNPVNIPPEAHFSYSCTSGTRTCSFGDLSTDADGAVTAWSWNFGDGQTSTTRSPSHQYAADGTYTVALTVMDNEGANAATSIPVTTINQQPSASFSASCNAGSCVFSNRSSDPDGTIQANAWTFGDGGTATTEDATHNYVSYGSYAVTLRVTDNLGASATALMTIVPALAPAISSPTQYELIRTATVPISGTGPPNASIVVREGTAQVATATANASGAWSTSATFSTASHSIRATATTPQGTSPASPLRTFVVDTDLSGPPQPSITSPVTGGATAASFTVTGVAPGNAATVFLYEGTKLLASRPVTGNAFTIALMLTNGSHTLHAITADAQSDRSQPSPTVTFTTDALPPEIAFTTASSTIFLVPGSMTIRGTAFDNTDTTRVVVEFYDQANRAITVEATLEPPDENGVRAWSANPGIFALPGRQIVRAYGFDVWNQRSATKSITVYTL